MKYIILLITLIALLISYPACSQKQKDMPIILVTDFGTDDYRVPRLKGVIYSNNPNAEIIDATHGIGSVDIAAGAYVLGLTAAEFPGKTVFLAAVGAGSTVEEKSLVVINDKDQIFILPDNGLITFVAMNMGIKSVHAISQKLFNEPMANLSSHQILGKVAAMIAASFKPEEVGQVVDNPIMLTIQKPSIIDGRLVGYVVFIDHFGNCLTNITQDDVLQFGLKTGSQITITLVDTNPISIIGERYSDVAVGESISIINSLGILQLSINKGSFASTYKLKTGLKIEIESTNP